MKRPIAEPPDQSRPWPASPRWFALMVLPRCEFVVAHEAEKLRAFTWTPTRDRTEFLDRRDNYRKWSKLTSKPVPLRGPVRLPLLPGLIFVSVESFNQLYAVRDLPKAIGVISDGLTPLRIRAAEMIRFRKGLKEAQGKAEMAIELKLGTKYRLKLKGLLGSLEGQIEAIPKSGDYVTLLSLSGLKIRAHRDALEEVA